MSKDLVLSKWLGRLDDAGVLMAKRSEAESQLGGWLELLFLAADGDTGSEAELYRLVALSGRNLGQSGRPASAAILQIILLEDTLRDQYGDDHPYGGRARELVKITADAHALGQSERQEERHRQTLRNGAPVLRIDDRRIVGWLIGPLLADSIDALLGRIFRECASAGADVAIIDLSTSTEPNDLFFRTVKGYAESDIAPKYELVVTGIADIARAVQKLGELGADLSRVTFAEHLRDYLHR